MFKEQFCHVRIAVGTCDMERRLPANADVKGVWIDFVLRSHTRESTSAVSFCPCIRFTHSVSAKKKKRTAAGTQQPKLARTPPCHYAARSPSKKTDCGVWCACKVAPHGTAIRRLHRTHVESDVHAGSVPRLGKLVQAQVRAPHMYGLMIRHEGDFFE